MDADRRILSAMFRLDQGPRPAGSIGSARMRRVDAVKSHLGIVSLCLALGAAHCSSKPQVDKAKQKTSTGITQMKNDVFGMESRDYFTDPGKNFSEVGYRMADSGQQGLLLGGPGYVAHDKDARFPVSCLNVSEALDLRNHHFRSYALVTAVDLATGSFYAGQLIEQRFKKEKLDPNASPPPPGISFDGSAGNLFARLEIPRHSAEYLITGILLDRVSNRIKIRVGSDAARTDVAKFASEVVDGTKAEVMQHQLLRTRSLDKEPESPLMPGVVGIHAAIVVPPKTPFDSQDALEMYVSYKLPKLPVKVDGSPRSELVFYILFTGSRVPTPGMMQVTVPVLPANRAEDGTLQGYFSLDVNQGHNFGGNQTYSVYLFSGEALGAVPKVILP